MVFPIPSLPNDRILPRRDLDIIACQRGGQNASASYDRTFGIRWASRPDLGFPEEGYFVERSIEGSSPEPVGHQGGTFHLPLTGDWAEFAQEVENRRPLAGPYFPPADITEDNLSFLLPLIRLVDPRTPTGEHRPLTEVVAAEFGNSHAEDAELTVEFWPDGNTSPLADLLGDPQTAHQLIAFYRRHALGYLLALAVRFEYAVLLGLATDDHVEKGRQVIYYVSAQWKQWKPGSGRVASDESCTNRPCAPKPPAFLKAERIPGSVAHPAFNDFTGWSPPPEVLAVDSNQNLQTAESMTPRVPAGVTALEWVAPVNTGRLIDHEPVLYELRRFEHGAQTAGDASAPPPPPDADYKPIFDGELMLRSQQAPHALDSFGMRWPAMEGYYHYQIRGVDLLGVKSPQATVAGVRHHDDIPPPAPGLRLANEQTITFDDPTDSRDVELNVVWHGAHDFVGPDTIEFRVAARWRARRAIHVQLLSVAPAVGNNFVGIATLDEIPVPADSLAGMRLIQPDGEYPIIGHGAGPNATMQIRRVAGRLPAAGQDALIYSAVVVSAQERIAKFARRPAVSAFIGSVHDTTPLRFELTPAGSGAIPAGEDFSVYVHLLRTSLPAVHESGGIWRIEQPPADDPRRESWDHWLALPDPAGLMSGSPAIVFPDHRVSVSISPPSGFSAGLLMLDVTAADDTDYVDSPGLPAAHPSLGDLKGNESTATTATISARVLLPPDAPTATPYDPNRYIWATSAAKYAEEAEYVVEWSPVDAAHYEVWRVLEGALDGAWPGMDDTALRTLAAVQSDKFALRSLKVFGPRYRDTLPGRAPTRVLYRVRAVSEAGVTGPWSDLIGPVHVPDVRQPPPPNFVRLTAPKPIANTPGSAERRLILEWAQAGPHDDLRFDIEMHNRDDDQWSVVGVIPRGTTPEPGPPRLYRHTVSGLTPGEKRTLRIRAVREARDPIDPLGQQRRDIASLPSESRAGRALGALAGPMGLTGTHTADAMGSSVTLNWSNQDPYQSVEILRQAPDEFRLRRIVGLDGAIETYTDSDMRPGLWRYQIRAIGFSRKAESAIVEVEAP